MSFAFIFPGQGSQAVGMGKELADAFPAAKAVFDEVDAALGEKLSDLIWTGSIETLTLTANAQPALMAVSLAVSRTLEKEFGVGIERAAFVAGHSLGEYSALAAAGAITLADTARLAEFRKVFDVQADCLAADLAEAARTSVALDRLVEKHRLGSLAYYYKGTGVPENEAAIASIILGTSLFTARGIPVAGEYEVKNAQAMKIMDTFGAGGSFTEYYAMDFNDDIVLMGHDGPAGSWPVLHLDATLDELPGALRSINSQRHDLVRMLRALSHLSGDYTTLEESEDITDLKQVVACAGGACEGV